MLKFITFLTLLALSGAPLPASDLAGAMGKLTSDDYAERTEARQTVADTVQRLSAPDADASARQSCVETLLQHVSSDHPFPVRDWAIRQLSFIGGENVVEPLVPLLADPEPKIRDVTRKTLSRVPDPAATRALLSAAPNAQTPEELRGYLDAIAQSAASEGGIALLVQQAKSPAGEDAAVAATAMNALAAIDSEASRQALLSLWGAVPPEVSGQLQEALLVCPLDTAQLQRLAAEGTNLAVRTGAFARLLQQDSAVALALLGHSEFPVRADLLKAAMARPEAAEVIRQSFESLSQDEKRVVLGGVKDFQVEAFQPVIQKILAERGDGELRRLALLCAIEIPSLELMETMARQYPDAPTAEQVLIQRAISAVRAPEFDVRLVGMVRDGSPEEKEQAIRYVRLRNPEGSLEMINAMLAGEISPAARDETLAAAEALGNMKTVQLMLEKILAVEDQETRRKLQISLKRLAASLNAPEAVWDEAFEPVLEGEEFSPEQKAHLIAILDCAPGRQTLAYLQEAALSDNATLRDAALNNLARWRIYGVGEVYRELAQNEGFSADKRASLWQQAVRALDYSEGRPGIHRRAEDAAKLFAAAPDQDVKTRVLEYLAQWPERNHPRAKEALAERPLDSAEQELVAKYFP